MDMDNVVAFPENFGYCAHPDDCPTAAKYVFSYYTELETPIGYALALVQSTSGSCQQHVVEAINVHGGHMLAFEVYDPTKDYTDFGDDELKATFPGGASDSSTF